MARETDIQLAVYQDIQYWKPQVGDIIIKHGWFIRTKWFGVVSKIGGNKLTVIKDGMMRLLVRTPEESFISKSIDISVSKIKSSVRGGYTVHQFNNNQVVWYV